MKAAKNILFYFGLAIALSGYIGSEFFYSFVTAKAELEILDTQNESESREFEERTHVEEYLNNNLPELKDFLSPVQKQYYFLSHFIPIDYPSLVWIPPKLS